MKKITKHTLDIFQVNFFIFFIIVFIGYNDISYAYIDPGTGMFIIQSILAIGGAIIFYLGYPIRLIKSLFNRFFSKKKIMNNQENEKKK